MRTLILNPTMIVADGQNNKMVYRFPNSVNFPNHSIALASVSMYYSWFNITSTIGNNTFSYNWIDNLGVPATYNIVVPDGLYEISTINSLCQFQFIQNGHYLVNASGENVYYGEFVVNASRYAVQINTYLVPTSLPAGWTNPAGLLFPPQTFNPIITLPPNINLIFGYIPDFATDQNLNNAFVPPPSQYVSKLANGTISYISTSAPQVQPNPSLLLSISNIDNAYSSPSSLIYTITPQVAIGAIINEKPSQFIWNKLIKGVYNELRLTILGTDLNPIKINDPNITIVLIVKDDTDS